jgi:hypothetical protein
MSELSETITHRTISSPRITCPIKPKYGYYSRSIRLSECRLCKHYRGEDNEYIACAWKKEV